MIRTVIRVVVLVVVAAFVVFAYAVPFIPVQVVYVAHCNEYVTRSVSITYYLFGVGVERWELPCQ